MKMKIRNYHLTELQITQLKKVSEITGLPIAEQVRRAVDKYLELYKEELKEKEKQNGNI